MAKRNKKHSSIMDKKREKARIRTLKMRNPGCNTLIRGCIISDKIERKYGKTRANDFYDEYNEKYNEELKHELFKDPKNVKIMKEMCAGFFLYTAKIYKKAKEYCLEIGEECKGEYLDKAFEKLEKDNAFSSIAEEAINEAIGEIERNGTFDYSKHDKDIITS